MAAALGYAKDQAQKGIDAIIVGSPLVQERFRSERVFGCADVMGGHWTQWLFLYGPRTPGAASCVVIAASAVRALLLACRGCWL